MRICRGLAERTLTRDDAATLVGRSTRTIARWVAPGGRWHEQIAQLREPATSETAAQSETVEGARDA